LERALGYLGSGSSQSSSRVLFEVDGISFEILNVYASNNAHCRCSLWKWYALSLPPIMWVMCGDFNMIEKPSDKVGHHPMQWAIRKRQAWYFIQNKLNLFDPNACFSPLEFLESLWYTWSNFQAGHARIIK